MMTRKWIKRVRKPKHVKAITKVKGFIRVGYRGRAGALVFTGVSLGTAFITLILASQLVNSFLMNVPPSQRNSGPSELLEAPYGITPEPTSIYSPSVGHAPRATLVITVRGVMPEEGKVIAGLSMTIPDELREQLWDTRAKTGIVEAASRNLLLKPGYGDFAMSLRVGSRLGDRTIFIRVPFRDVIAEREHARREFLEVTLPLEIPVAAAPRFYPSDWYWAYADLDVTLPPQIPLYDTTMVGRARYSWFLPVELKVASAPGMAGKVMRLSTYPADPDYYPPRPLELLIQRDWQTRRFVYAMAVIPLGFVLLLTHFLFFATRSKSSEEPHLFMAEMAAAMLAVLPLRQVIVASDVGALTRVDLILGIELGLMVCVALIRYTVYLWRR